MPRYVLLEHRRAGDDVHWDFMLEAGPALATWALAAPAAPGTVVDARRLPDHRVAYLDYEGPISGDRGSVRRVDRGMYEVVGWSAALVRVRLMDGHLEGLAELRQAEGPDPGSDQAWTFRLLLGKTS